MMQHRYKSPFGPLFIQLTPKGVSHLSFSALSGANEISRDDHTDEVISLYPTIVSALDSYFAGDGEPLDAVPIDVQGTEFQREVWLEARNVRFGETTSYGELASRIGRSQSSRAVGAALGANPVCVIIPCHRIISSEGKLHGFSGGLDKKARLLQHERAVFRGVGLGEEISPYLEP